MTTIFTTDIHGNYDTLKRKMDYMLNKYPQAEIVFGGDYVDGRKEVKVKEVLTYIYSLGKTREVKYLLGNHEQMLLDFYKFNDMLWFKNGAKKTIKSLFGRGFSKSLTKKNLSQYKLDTDTYLIHWLKNLLPDYENEDGYFVHAYINPDWDLKKAREKTSTEDKIWNRGLINCEKNLTGKTIIVGHTPVQEFSDEVKPAIKSEKYYPVYFCDGGSNSGDENSNLFICVFDKGKMIEYI